MLLSQGLRGDVWAKVTVFIDGLKGGLRRLLAWRTLLLLLLIVLGSYAIYTFYSHDPASNSTCTLCHSMVPYYREFLVSPHRSLNCYSCHEFSPWIMAREFLSYVIENPSPQEIAKGEIRMYSECSSCHTIQSIGRLQSHSTHLGLITSVKSCTICHVGHSMRVTSGECLRCHSMSEVETRHRNFHREAEDYLRRGIITCQECHASKAEGGKPLDAESLMGVVRGLSCFDCHEPPLREVIISGRECTECHA